MCIYIHVYIYICIYANAQHHATMMMCVSCIHIYMLYTDRYISYPYIPQIHSNLQQWTRVFVVQKYVVYKHIYIHIRTCNKHTAATTCNDGNRETEHEHAWRACCAREAFKFTQTAGPTIHTHTSCGKK